MIFASLAGVLAWIKALFGAGDVAAGAVAGAAEDRQARADLDTSAGNVAEADRIAAEAGVAGPDEPTPPASPAARRPIDG